MLQRQASFRPNEKFCPLPAKITSSGLLRLTLHDLPIDDPTDTMAFHVIGDSGGIKDPNPQANVAKLLTADLNRSETLGLVKPSFLYHLGDVVYYNGDHSEYFPQFYEAYESYTAPIFAIPGNHDGDNSDDLGVPSLDAFMQNFCAPKPVLHPDAKDVDRDTMVQPYCYWTLMTNLVTVIGLYSNVPSGGSIHADQQKWLLQELAAAPKDRPLIVALHHPPYSMDAHHGGSLKMGEVLDHAFQQTARTPELILSGHVHNYQRFARANGATYVVLGNSGYHNLHAMAADAAIGLRIKDIELRAYDDKNWGYLYLRVEKGSRQIYGEYVSVNKAGHGMMSDHFTAGT